MGFNVAIDGPAGAGKSTIAKMVAKNRGFIYVDTGALYRALGYSLLQAGVDTNDKEAVTKHLPEVNVELAYEAGEQQVLANGKNVSKEIRREEVGNIASKISAIKEVRAKLLDLQKDIASKNDVVMDGRDIGTFVLPEAQVKIYLTASVFERANRRYQELIKKGEQPELSQIEADIEQRDYQDMHREIAPLKQAEDAHLVDSSRMTIAEVVARIEGYIDEVM
ncbi:(d)CMP kinase [Ohessyouella blattaphilus]|uniref:Cytidylate kinase n=1 Tax=Ohessyouella blattaphilus TaxID=2949333 RepID=A0ABT1EF28_9FIRM|nr:(d)CMP kinase [Ohessyouella blattaphilus]MCP1109304.1 (d)CMP kinase [Ohessyouella blattaphilus]MCR8562698.1 (d)CMP kinase [Ohessyouella blattaphilus]